MFWTWLDIPTGTCVVLKVPRKHKINIQHIHVKSQNAMKSAILMVQLQVLSLFSLWSPLIYLAFSCFCGYDPQMMRMSFSVASVRSSSTHCQRLWPTSGSSAREMPCPWPQSHWPPTASTRLPQRPQPSSRPRLLPIARYSFVHLFIYSSLLWESPVHQAQSGHSSGQTDWVTAFMELGEISGTQTNV